MSMGNTERYGCAQQGATGSLWPLCRAALAVAVLLAHSGGVVTGAGTAAVAAAPVSAALPAGDTDTGSDTASAVSASGATGATVMRQSAQLPHLGEAGGLTYAQERAAGEQIVSEFTAHPDYVDDVVLQDYADGVWRNLLSAARSSGFTSAAMSERFVWRLHLLRDPSVNAFVTPGGVMGIHLGLLSAVENTDELASVLAHETSHVSQRHISRLIDADKRQTPMQIAAVVVAAVAASQGNGQAAQAVVMGGQALAAQRRINFTRSMEQEADRVGFLLMKQAGYAPRGFVTMFDRLYRANRLNDDGSFPYLRTHPLSRQRMADMQARVGIQRSAAAQSGAVGVQSSGRGGANPAHALLRQRARLLARNDSDTWQAAVRRVADTAASDTSLSDLYAAVFAACLLKDREQIAALSKRLEQLAKQHRRTEQEQRQIRLLLAEAALLTGKAERALELLHGRHTLLPRPEALLLAQARIQTDRIQLAADGLQDWLAAHPQDAQAWNTLAQAYQAQGKLLRAVGAQAKAEESNFNYGRAIDRLRAGQHLYRSGQDRDLIEAQVLDARLKELLALQKRQDAVLEGLK